MKFRKKYVWIDKWNYGHASRYKQAVRRFGFDDFHDNENFDYYHEQIREYREDRKENESWYGSETGFDSTPLYPY
jgi:hypothetical protein